jgi:hypothetical protein
MKKTVFLAFFLTACADEGVADLVGGEAGVSRRGPAAVDASATEAAALDEGAGPADLQAPDFPVVDLAAVPGPEASFPVVDVGQEPGSEAGSEAGREVSPGPEVGLDTGRDLAPENGREAVQEAGPEVGPEAGPEAGTRPEAGPEARACDPACHVGCYVGCTALGSCVACSTCTCETGTGACHC